MPPPPAPLAIPDHIAPHAQLASDELAEWQLLPTAPDWAGGLRASWKPGELGARQQLEEFLRHAADAYAANRNVPGVRGTSRLSPHLHWGEISVGTVWHACQGDTPTAQTFLAELLWRDFAAYLLWHHPELPNAPLRPAFEKLPWRDAATDLGAWQRGLTGVPIVDAGMRELWQTGWMHNRVRMIVASFLCKHLLIDWRLGERWFWDTLVDADLASNAASWQWVAGTGIDSQPFFRVFNPVTQGEKFDPDGYYVRRFVPEIAGLPDRFLHAPWTAPDLVLRASGVTLGQTYPARLVDLNLGRTRALDIYTRTVRAA